MKRTINIANAMTGAIADTMEAMQYILQDVKEQNKPTEEQMTELFDAYNDVRYFLNKLEEELTTLDKLVNEE